MCSSHRGAAAVAGKRRHGVVWNVLGVLMEILFTLAAVCALYIVWQMWWTGVQAEHEQVEARQSVAWESPATGVLMEILFTLAAVCALYIVWQMWWTGVQAEHEQVEARQSVAWESPATDGEQTKVAPKQEGDPPVQPEQAAEGDLIAQIYIPRFGDQWERNIVEGTTLEQLNKHGMGHYTTSQMPGELGNTAEQAWHGALHHQPDARGTRQLRRGGPSQRLRPTAGRRRQTAAGRRDCDPHPGLLVRVPLHRV